MRIAFLTMVWRDYWLLEKWVRHNASVVPRSQLYVINHGGDPEVARIAEGCNIISVPREDLTIDLTRRRWDLLGGVTNGLLAFYDRVIVTDVDELILYTGPRDGGLIEHLAAKEVSGAALSPVGLNLIPTPQDGTDPDAPVLSNHPHALLSAKYTKPCIAAQRVVYTVGGHGLIRGAFEIDPELVMVHLHYVTPDYAERMAARREIVAETRATNEASEAPLDMGGRYWINWAKPDMIRDKEMGIFDRAREMDVSGGFAACAEILRAAVRKGGKKVVVEPAVVTADPVRVTLPEALRKVI